jgi:hypothetical protein
MTEYYETGAAGNLARNANDLFNPKGERPSAKDQLDSFVRMTHEQIREPLSDPKVSTKHEMDRIWTQAKLNDEKSWVKEDNVPKLKSIYGKKVPQAMKLMYCWAKEALKQGRITQVQSTKIIDALPEKLVELPSPNPPTNPESPSTDTDGKIRQVAVRDDYIAQSAAVPIVVEEDEERDNATKDNGYTLVDVMCHESVFYTKTSNIERQLKGSVFSRSEKLFKQYAKDSKAMIDKAVKLKTTFEPHW